MPSGRRLSREDIDAVLGALERTGGNKKDAAAFLGLARSQLYKRLEIASREGIVATTKEEKVESPFATPYAPPLGTTTPHIWEIKSTKDNKYKFAVFGDLHAASKYCRWDVRENLTRLAEDFGAQAILDTGNWIDGEKSFNRYDLEAVGLEAQLQCLARNYPQTKIPTYAITGSDHEGWYVKSEGIDVGRNCEDVMRRAGHLWTNLGYMEADILLRNANSGVTAIMRLMHPSGGSAYAYSYKPQKIVESMEGGEKPDVLLIGHYHKLDSSTIRNVWVAQTACQQDQTPFLRGNSIAAHIGGILLEMEQDPSNGTIIGFKPDMRRYYNRAYYFKAGHGNQRWSGSGPIRQVPRGANIKE